MPKVESHNDRAAKQGLIASHRWPGANTVAPLFYGQTKQVELTTEFLKKDVIALDIFAMRREATGDLIAPLLNNSGAGNQEDGTIAPQPGEEVTIEVIVSNRNAAHSFPPEVRDLYEAWVEFEALDARGKAIFHSGYLKPDGTLDETAHVYKQIILDEQGRQITRHQIWTTNIKAYDNAIQAGRSDIARFRFRLPDCPAPGLNCQPLPLTLRARVNYRRVNREYASYVSGRQKRELPLPLVRMAETEIRFVSNPLLTTPNPLPVWKRWNDYSIGLLEQGQYGEAATAFRRAAEHNPADVNLLVNAAIAELRTERFAHHERPQLAKAAGLLERAEQIPGQDPAGPARMRLWYYRALVWRAQGRLGEAAAELARIAEAFPRDREIRRQLAQTRYSLGELSLARQGFEAILNIDPTDFGAYQFLAPLYLSEGRAAEAERADKLYLQWRDDPRADAVAARFFAAHPEWADERIGAHMHGQAIAQRPVLTGTAAAPDR
ncbi:MAG: tetratricopeptide repeat protein [Blastocatellia bacterium]